MDLPSQATDMTDESSIVGRLAPSPTGGLHVGHARTFLLAWLSARSSGGRVVLRIEDIDAQRVRPGVSEAMITDLKWLGLDWDEGPDLGGPHAPYLQSMRREIYDSAIRRLATDERIYPCTCTRADILRAASAPHAGEEGPEYPGTCAYRSSSDARELGDRPFAWRFRASGVEHPWQDLVRGPIAGKDATARGDFIVGRSSGEPTYQLAVVCDDAAMKVNQVVRGDDLIASTPRQIALYRAMGWEVPTFGHVPLVLDAEGKRLAKRDGSIKLATLRESGVDPRELLKRIAQSCELDGHAGWPSDFLPRFALDRLPRDPWTIPSAF